jgi:Zn-dependent M16 (insulinase) family peptidase
MTTTMRKLEYFEDELDASPLGREILAVIRRHMDEVTQLVNHNRTVTVAWQRNHGPGFLTSAMDSGFDANTAVRKEIDGVSLERLLLRMADALQQSGSRELAATIGRYASPALVAARECVSLTDLFTRIRAGGLAGGAV